MAACLDRQGDANVTVGATHVLPGMNRRDRFGIQQRPQTCGWGIESPMWVNQGRSTHVLPLRPAFTAPLPNSGTHALPECINHRASG